MPKAAVKIRVIPRAARTELSGWRGDSILVRLQAPPVEGAANKALLKFLADALGVRQSDLRIVAGDKSRDKVIEVDGKTQDEVLQTLGGEAAGG
jgi:uncharacterized protein